MPGITDSEEEQVRAWSDAIGEGLRTKFANLHDAFAAAENFRGHITRPMAERRSMLPRDPKDYDLLDVVIEAIEGNEGLTELEVVAMLTMLLFAGHETTTNLISSSIVTLVERPNLWAEPQGRLDQHRA